MPLGCACLFALGAAAAPRLVLLFTWLFTPLVSRAFDGAFFLPLLGIIFLPFTTLMYVLAWSPVVGVTGWGWFWVLIGLFLDLGSYGGSAYGNRGNIRNSYRVQA
jgi:hypothetical protein